MQEGWGPSRAAGRSLRRCLSSLWSCHRSCSSWRWLTNRSRAKLAGSSWIRWAGCLVSELSLSW